MLLLPDLRPEEILIYLRKSRTDDPALSAAETVAKHEQMLDDWCRNHLGALVPEENRYREVVSGETIAAVLFTHFGRDFSSLHQCISLTFL